MYRVLAENLRKPLLDNCEYRLIQLANGLTALLIQDGSTDRAAASLDVYVGAYKDKYYQTPGLAHFCEHLLFQGTEKYPQDNAYKAFLAKHGGRSNAGTSFEHTTYVCELHWAHLDGALDRLSRFFIDPLFLESCKDREINAVDHENKKNLQLDSRRLSALTKATSNPNHPFNYFTTGNIHTLGQLPKSRGQNVRDLLIDFYESNYSSNLMNLVVLGKEPLDSLSTLVAEKFATVKNLALEPPKFDEPVFTEHQLGKIIFAQSIRDKNELKLTFNTPLADEEEWRYIAPQYFSHLAGHESNGSVYHYLHSLGLVNSVSAANQRICKDNYWFEIACDLTEKGLQRYEDVVVTIFQYLSVVTQQGPQKWIFDEIKQSRDISFRFRQKSGAFDTVRRLSRSLFKFSSIVPPEHVLDSSTQIVFDPERIQSYARHFDPKNLRILLSSKSYEALPLKEEWYGTPYSIEDIAPTLVEKVSRVEPNSNLHLPDKNPFIPADFQFHGKKADTPLKAPHLVVDDNKHQIWYKKDDQFEVPKLNVSTFLHLSASNKDAKSSLMTSLFCDLVADELNDIGYYASLFNYSYSVSAQKDGIYVNVYGFNDKISELLRRIVELLPQFKPKEDMFEIIKTRMRQKLQNHKFIPAFNQIDTDFLLMVNDRAYSHEERLEELDKINYEHLVSFIENHLWSSGVYTESLFVGNLNNSELQEIKILIRQTFDGVPAIDESKEDVRAMIGLASHIHAGRVLVNKTLADDQNVNSCISYLVHLGTRADHRTIALAELVATILQEPCFHRLRTNEQLGYVVRSGIYQTRSSIGYKVLVASTKPCAYLCTRIESFLLSMKQHLADISDDEFATFKNSLIEKKRQKLKNLAEEANKLWSPILDGYFDFRKDEKLIAMLENITQDETAQFFIDKIHPNSHSPRLVFNLNSKKVKVKALESILGAEYTELIEKFQIDLQRLVEECNKHGDKQFKVADVEAGLAQLFPEIPGKEVKYEEFKTTFPKGEVPSSVDDIAEFHQPSPLL